MMTPDDFKDRQYEISVTAGMNQRYHQAYAHWWTGWNRSVQIVVAVLAVPFAGMAQGVLSSGGWLVKGSESSQVADRIAEAFGGGRSSMIVLLRSIDPHLVVLNTDEATALVGEGTPADLADRVARQLDTVGVVTRATGATAAFKGSTLDVAARPVARVVDSTGAGDAFAAALIATS